MKYIWMLAVLLIPVWSQVLAQDGGDSNVQELKKSIADKDREIEVLRQQGSEKDREIQELRLRIIELKGKLLAKAAEVDRLTDDARKLKRMLPADSNVAATSQPSSQPASQPASQPSTQPASLTDYRFAWQKDATLFLKELALTIAAGKNIDEELSNRLVRWTVTVQSVELEAQITVRFTEAEPYLYIKPPLDVAINLRSSERGKAASLKPGSRIVIAGKTGNSVVSGGGERFLLWPMDCTIEEITPPKEDPNAKAAVKPE